VFEKALKGSAGYGIWVAVLLLLVATGFFFYLKQLGLRPGDHRTQS